MRKKLSILISTFLLLCLTSCHFFASFTEVPEVELNFDKNTSSLSIGEMDIINLKASGLQNEISITWEYDDSIIMAKTDNYSAVITGLKPGETTLKATCGQNSASCLITVSDESYAGKYFTGKKLHNLPIGYINQEICKLSFWEDENSYEK